MENVEKSDKETRLVAGVAYWTSKKAARYLGISKQGLHVHARKNHVSKLDFGGFILFKKEWLDDFVKERTVIGNATRKKDKDFILNESLM